MKTTLITGAGSGVGRGIALVLAERGARTAVCDVDAVAAKDAATEIKASGYETISGLVDVTSSKSLTDFVSETEDRLGAIDVCVANAGVIGGKGFSERKMYSDNDWDTTWAVNLRGVVNTCEAVKSGMIERHSGSIVIVASHGGRKPRGVGDEGRGNVQTPYSVSKAAVIQYMHLTAIDMAPYDVRVNAVCPGRLWTPIWSAIAENHKNMNPEAFAGMETEEVFNVLVRSVTPLRRPQTPRDIGAAVAFLASQDARNITGQALNINGGAIMN